MLLSVYKKILFVSLTTLLISSCGGMPDKTSRTGAYKIGNPYKVEGRWYYPKEQANYDATGTASWYGKDFHRKNTANGAVFDRHEITAAHKTLPLPSMVRVTNLDNKKTIVVMVNDRGPFSRDRILDVSEKTAELLGFKNKGTAKVRVQFLKDETEQLLAALPGGKGSVKLASTSGPRPYPSNSRPVNIQDTKVAELTRARYFIQTGTYGMIDNARRAEKRLAALGPVSIMSIKTNDRVLYKVKLGPLPNKSTAMLAIQEVKNLGYTDVVIIEMPV